MSEKIRFENDSMGEVQLPEDALWGAQTQRAVENFTVSDLKIPGPMLKALAMIKGRAAVMNRNLNLIPEEISRAVEAAAIILEEGGGTDEFPVDVFQTGSGTSWNMNINEVISNMANIELGGAPGSKAPVHPNDHVNRGQSSNDVIPTAINIAARLEAEKLSIILKSLAGALEAKAVTFSGIPKLGRTHLQDAVPMTLGQEFSGFAAQIRNSVRRLENTFFHLEELALGGTALGTGLNTHPEFAPGVISEINNGTGVPFRQAENLFEAIAARDSNMELMSALNGIAVSLMKIAQDLRLLSSGPRAALGEISLPSLQPGSSIMPGKVNPVIPEMVIQAAASVMGRHTTVTIACQNSPLQLNIMQPLIAYELLFCLDLLSNTSERFLDKCISGIEADKEKCRGYIEWSLAVVTPLALSIGYDRAASVAHLAYEEGITVREAALKKEILSKDELDVILDIDSMTGLD